MRPNRLTHALALLAIFSVILLSPARADEDEVEDEYEERARVMRVSLTKGEVSLRRAGETEWEAAGLNLPLVEGDTLATGPDSRLEIQLDARNFIRLGAETVLRVVTLREEGVALSLSEGTAVFRLARFERGREFFEVDAPGTTVAAEERGLYRLDVGRDGAVGVTVRDEGRARIYSETAGFVLRDKRAARLASGAEGDWELSVAAPFDEWDRWNDERERHLAARLRLDGRERYYDPEVWGAEELDAYGDWVQTREHGYVWRPHVTVINRYHDWAPYRYGHWRHMPHYGWTWIPDEEWGWAPYHHGRWVYVNNYWGWAPRGYGYRYRRAWWRPALVAFVFIPTPRGEQVCWYPLRPGQRDPRGRHRARPHDRGPRSNGRGRDGRRHTEAPLLRAVTSVPAGEFGAERARARAAAMEVAQRALAAEPVGGRLPFAPRERPRAAGGAGRGLDAPSERRNGERGRLVITRPAPLGPTRTLSERPTGAAARAPGVALNEELRRTRLYGNRQPRTTEPAGAGAIPPGETNTGALARPSRRHGEGEGAPSAPRARPARPSPEGGGGRPNFERPPRTERRGGDDDAGRTRERPSRPEWRERPPVERPAARPSAPTENARPRREFPSAPRTERPSPGESRPPRSEPRPETPRHERPRQETPRQEAPRQERPAAPPRGEQPSARERQSDPQSERDQR